MMRKDRTRGPREEATITRVQFRAGGWWAKRLCSCHTGTREERKGEIRKVMVIVQLIDMAIFHVCEKGRGRKIMKVLIL
jgi:hypothetical protein